MKLSYFTLTLPHFRVRDSIRAPMVGVGFDEAITELDQVTQQNAALVEESAAAADSLSQQAAKPAEIVSAFKLGTGDRYVAPVATPDHVSPSQAERRGPNRATNVTRLKFASNALSPANPAKQSAKAVLSR